MFLHFKPRRVFAWAWLLSSFGVCSCTQQKELARQESTADTASGKAEDAALPDAASTSSAVGANSTGSATSTATVYMSARPPLTATPAVTSNAPLGECPSLSGSESRPDPCGLDDCANGPGCCHNAEATERNAPSSEFLAWCLPKGEQGAPLDPTCQGYRCSTPSDCRHPGCRLKDGRCGIVIDTYVVVGGEEILVSYPNLGCVDERWLICRNPSGIPPDATLQCAVDYWASAEAADAGVPALEDASIDAPASTMLDASLQSADGAVP